MLGSLSRGACVLACVAIASVPTSAAWAETGDDETGSSGSLAQQLAVALDGSLGDDATMALLRSYDRGFAPLETTQAAFQGALASDGTITDDGTAVTPSLRPANLIDAQSTPKVERGIAKTTKRFDKLVDLAERAERFDVGDDAFMALVTTALTLQGYSPEQIIVDGFMGNGIFLEGKPGLWTGIKIVDENGKTVRPDGVEAAGDDETAQEIDSFVDSVIDAVVALDPGDAAQLPLAGKVGVTVKLDVADAGGDGVRLRAFGYLGTPKEGSLERYLAGGAEGSVSITGTCSGTPFEAHGPVGLGLSGVPAAKAAPVKVAVLSVSLGGDLPKSCLGSLDLLELLLMAQTFGPVAVSLDRGVPERGFPHKAAVTFEDSSGTLEILVGPRS